MNKTERIKELTKMLNEYRNAYYNESESIISDYEYDKLYDELEKLENETGLSFANSPTKTVGFQVKSELEKIKHSHPMLSLDKTKSVDELRKFAGDKDCILSLKMDGLTCLLTYENGSLVQAETRGNGDIGELITHNANVFENIPLTIEYKGHFEIEGEAIITYDDFEKINKVLPEDKKYKNPRNLVSGSVRQLDSRIAAQRHVKFIAWKVPTEVYSNSFLNRLKYAEKLGFEIVPLYTYSGKSSDKENLPEMIELLKTKAHNYGYPIDGLVMTYNDIQYGESLGMTGHHPKHSIAFKFAEDSEDTILREVEWGMGKTGVLTPVAIFDSVDLAGTSVSRASLHNISIMKELNISIGSIVTVVKKNEIIPQIISCDANTMNVNIPATCPVCGGDTQIAKENDTEVLLCVNPHCKSKLLGKLSAFVSRNKMNIDGLSEETLSKFIARGWLTCFSDIYKLKDYYIHMINMSGFGRKSIDKLIDSIEKSRSVELNRFIAALSIPGVGDNTAKDISKHCGYDFDTFVLKLIDKYNWSVIDGIGEKTSQQINEWIDDSGNREDFRKLLQTIIPVNLNTNDNTDQSLAGKNFVVTGDVTQFKNRKELQKFIESKGGKVTGSVTSKTNWLINNDVESTSSKNKKARELGIPIISEKDFLEMVK
ncbi:MAG: NAD-dependent DNA ligase LigA [Faecalimonas umbilicata]|uniref:NAD-dependent DNA ligase LigA n=1 Tax=Faecalimonas umbilicata TaxID=1912855 RepID=UPI003995979D